MALVLLANPKTIYYFTGTLADATLPQAFALEASGKSLLVTNGEPKQTAAERVSLYTAYTLERVFNRASMHAEAVALMREFVEASPGPAAIEFESVSHSLGAIVAERGPSDITPVLNEMRRRKDADEIACMRATTALVEAGYAAIKAKLEPGMTEYRAHTIIYDAIVAKAETSVDLRGDFACGTRAINGGGPPTNARVRQGDLYIFDLFPTFDGYMCDLCRTFVAGSPSALQQDAWQHVLEAHKIARKLIRPGVEGREVYEGIRSFLETFAPARGSFNHHAGHGVGMEGWEYPWLTPGSHQVIQEGEVIACEPGLYSEALQGGIRLEHNYLVGKEGVTALDDFPIELR